MFRLGILTKTLSQGYLKAISKLSQTYRKSVFRLGILTKTLFHSCLHRAASVGKPFSSQIPLELTFLTGKVREGSGTAKALTLGRQCREAV